jgi:glycosyltransferase involved in cell wall biosynthesis
MTSSASASQRGGGSGIRAAIVTNMPAPYRVPVFERLAATEGIDLKVFFCAGVEPDRAWSVGPLGFAHEFLRERMFAWRGRYIHANPDVVQRLAAFAPDVVVTTGFNPSHLLAWRYALGNKAGHVAMTDGTPDWEARLGWLHRGVRRLVYRRPRAFVGASDKSLALFRSYGAAGPSLYRSVLCADNAAFAAAARESSSREFDFIYCGQFIARKMPLFAIDVAAGVAARIGRRVHMLMVGTGPLEQRARDAAEAHAGDLDCVFAGFATQGELPFYYARARMLLFPTAGDAWGVVANEACASGIPVIVSPQAGAAGELVRDGENGYVLGLDAAAWAEAAATLLLDSALQARMSASSQALVAPYTHAFAAAGLAAAIAHARR